MHNYSPSTWRLVRSGALDGATNMAVDEAILRSVADGLSPPTVRLYSWDPPCLSLGRGQPDLDVDRDSVMSSGYDLVRRPTGGRAILHVDELTYAVIAPETEPRVSGGIVESYRRLSRGLVRGLQLLGVDHACAESRSEEKRCKGPVCFEVPSDYEITARGRKLVGSAQMRSSGVVLQHGALPLYGDITRICSLLATRPDPSAIRRRATTLEECLARRVTWEEAAACIAAGLQEVLNLKLLDGGLTDKEISLAQVLRERKYDTEAWVRRA
jgi:lipoate-protein ligase A